MRNANGYSRVGNVVVVWKTRASLRAVPPPPLHSSEASFIARVSAKKFTIFGNEKFFFHLREYGSLVNSIRKKKRRYFLPYYPHVRVDMSWPR